MISKIYLWSTDIYMATTTASLSGVEPGKLPQTDADSATLSDILSIVFAIAGGLAFLIIVISGLRYILAGGDPQKAAKAKESIVYALVGLAIAISAQAIVAFVVRRV